MPESTDTVLRAINVTPLVMTHKHKAPGALAPVLKSSAFYCRILQGLSEKVAFFDYLSK